MELINYISGGITVVSVAALVLVINKFLEHLSGKDNQFVAAVDKFTATINNHIQHDVEVKEKLVASNDRIAESHARLEEAITKLVDKL